METEEFVYFGLWLITYLLAVILTICLSVYHYFQSASLYKIKEIPSVQLNQPISISNAEDNTQNIKVPHGLESIIEDLMNHIFRDYIESWFLKLVKMDTDVPGIAREDAKVTVVHLCDLLAEVPWVDFLVKDLPMAITDHIRSVRNARPKDGASGTPFKLHKCVTSPEDARRYHDVFSKLLCARILPKSYDPLTRQLISNILATQVLRPSIEALTDPDKINQSLSVYLQNQENLTLKYKTKFRYTESYETFVRMIIKCQDVQELIQIRYHIITEILHSTTLSNLRKPEDSTDQIAASSEGKSTRQKTQTNKADLLKNRDLKKYANQLRVAKSRCEKRIAELGGTEYTSYSEETKEAAHRGHKVLSFELIMHNLPCRAVLHAFLKDDDCESLLEYWVAVDTLRFCDPVQKHTIASEIYTNYITSSVSMVKPEKSVLKKMEAFLIGNRDADAFFETQDKVYNTLEDRYYPQFLVSERYHQFIVTWDSDLSEDSESYKDDLHADDVFNIIDQYEVEGLALRTQSQYIEQKIRIIHERIFNKTQALQVLLSSQRGEKYTSLISDLEAELEALRVDRRSLEAHQEQVESWWRNVGFWKAEVITPEATKESDGWKVHFPVVIKLQEQQQTSPNLPNGWVVSRTLQDFKSLRTQLIEIDEDLEDALFPSKHRLGKPSFEWLEKSKSTLNKFIEEVFNNRNVCYSAAVFDFVSTYTPTPSEKQHKPIFKVPEVFRAARPSADADQTELLFYNPDEAAAESNTKDSIAKSLYDMIGEIFELKGMSKPLRRTLIQIVQVTYGKSINRQLRSTVTWLISKPMCIYYLKLFKDMFWPQGQLAPPSPSRTDEQKHHTRLEAKSILLRNTPDVLSRLLGEKNGQKGLIKLFETLQHHQLNKHLAYIILSRFATRLLPDIEIARSKLHID